MKKLILSSSLSLLFIVIFSSCQKEVNSPQSGSSSNIEGNWKFISISLKSEVIDVITDGPDVIKSVSNSDYTSINNKGNILIDATQWKSTAISYDVSTTLYAKFYENGTLVDSLQQGLDITLPPYNSTSTYQRIGNDSLYFPNGSFVSLGDSPGSQTKPSGCKFRIEGNRMIINVLINETTQDNSQGIQQITTKKGTGSVVLEKQ